ncbi:hypothetical protein H4Q26_011196 [Puccinia striiformis f. sp. tritici PST-130]|nr:hypothetical protein H4Q26_011196 [Puccinia striiformis f. sp. tritici PST-130]
MSSRRDLPLSQAPRSIAVPQLTGSRRHVYCILSVSESRDAADTRPWLNIDFSSALRNRRVKLSNGSHEEHLSIHQSFPSAIFSIALLRRSTKNNDRHKEYPQKSIDTSFVDLLLHRDANHRCLVTGTANKYPPRIDLARVYGCARLANRNWRKRHNLKNREVVDSIKRTRIDAPITGHPVQPSQLASHFILVQSIDIHFRLLQTPPTFQNQQQNGLLRYLVTLLSVLVALSRAEEASSAKPEEVEDKFFFGNRFSNFNNFNYFNSFNTGNYLYYNNFNFYRTWSNTYSNIYGFGCFPQNSLSLRYFAKANEGAQSVSRRAISLDADQLVRRADTESVTCIAAKGVAQEFSVKDCVAYVHLSATDYANTLRIPPVGREKTSSATVGQCTYHSSTTKRRLPQPAFLPTLFEKTTRQVLKSCTNSVSETNMRLIPSHLLAIIHL